MFFNCDELKHFMDMTNKIPSQLIHDVLWCILFSVCLNYENKLYQHLIGNISIYNSKVRPVRNVSKTVDVEIEMDLVQITELVSATRHMHTPYK